MDSKRVRIQVCGQLALEVDGERRGSGLPRRSYNACAGWVSRARDPRTLILPTDETWEKR